MPSYVERARKFMLGILEGYNNIESAEFIVLSQNWTKASKDLEPIIERLANKGVLTYADATRLADYKELLTLSRRQVELFDRAATGLITEQQLAAGRLAMQSVQGQFEFSGIATKFRLLPVGAIDNMIGHTADGSPLYDILIRDYPDTFRNLTKTLIDSTVLGRNPRETARLMQDDMAGNFNRALRIARTEQLNVFRDAAVEQMKYSSVDEWEWLAEPDACEICLAEDGKRHPVEESMDAPHPNCRCAPLMVPPEE